MNLFVTGLIIKLFLVPTAPATDANLQADPIYPYCPNAVEIAPCTCMHGTGGLDLFPTITCENLVSERQLISVFSKTFPTYILRKIIITDSPLRSLPSFAFADKVTYELTINNTNIATVEEDAISHMNNTLEMLTMTYNNQLKTFPFATLANFGLLNTINMDSNDLGSIEDLPSLTNLKVISINNNLNFKNLTALPFLPVLEEFQASQCGISNIEPETFLYSPMLKIANISNNKLYFLKANSLLFTSFDLTTLDLSYCNILEVEEEAFNSSSVDVRILLSHNQLTELREDVFKPFVEPFAVYDGTGFIEVTGNPIVCCCSIDWLVSNRTYTGYFQGATCAGGAILAEIDPAHFIPICPPKEEEIVTTSLAPELTSFQYS